jgi:hypothetical protein
MTIFDRVQWHRRVAAGFDRTATCPMAKLEKKYNSILFLCTSAFYVSSHSRPNCQGANALVMHGDCDSVRPIWWPEDVLSVSKTTLG